MIIINILQDISSPDITLEGLKKAPGSLAPGIDKIFCYPAFRDERGKIPIICWQIVQLLTPVVRAAGGPAVSGEAGRETRDESPLSQFCPVGPLTTSLSPLISQS